MRNMCLSNEVMTPADRENVGSDEVGTIPSVYDSVESMHLPVIKTKRGGEEATRRLHRQDNPVTGGLVDPFTQSDIVEEEDAAI